MRDRRHRIPLLLAILVMTGALISFLRREGEAPAETSLLEASSGEGSSPTRTTDPRPSAAAVRAGSERRRRPALRLAWKPGRLEGTRFQQRLQYGNQLLRVRTELAAGELNVPSAFWLTRRNDFGLLLLERLIPDLRAFADRKEPPSKEALTAFLVQATKPARDRSAFTLHGTRAQIREYGETCLVRVWTLQGAKFPAYLIGDAEAVVHKLDALAGKRCEDGYDVLATPQCGLDVFPNMRKPSRAIGVYYHFDKLCVIGTDHDEHRLQTLLNHEVLHAWRYNAYGESWATRFVTEGMASYFAHIRKGDEGLQVPRRRLRHNMAMLLELVERLEGAGADFRKFSLATLVDAQPHQFYSLGWLGYGIAQACFAYVPFQYVEEAFRTGQAGTLMHLFRKITWHDLLAWIRETAREGKAESGWFVTDDEEGGLVWDDGASVVLRGALIKKLFGPLDVLDYEDALRRQRGVHPFRTAGRVRIVASVLQSEETHAIRVLVDRSTALDAGVRVRDDSPLGSWSGGVEQARDIVAHVVTATRDREPPPTLHLIGVGKKAERIEALGALYADALVKHLAAHAERAHEHWIVCIGATDARLHEGQSSQVSARTEAGRRTALHKRKVYLFMSMLLSAKVAPRSVLVLDLSNGAGEALAVAEALDRIAPERLQVAYWNPQQPLR